MGGTKVFAQFTSFTIALRKIAKHYCSPIVIANRKRLRGAMDCVTDHASQIVNHS